MSDSDDVATNCDFGSTLAKAREEQNYTVEKIHKQLKIPSHIIAAIEANDLDALPASTYTQGYIRNYARFLEISEDKVLDLYNRAVPHAQVATLKPRLNLNDETNSQSPLLKLVTILLLVVGMTTVLIGVFQYYQEKADDMGTELESKASAFTGNSLDSPGINHLKIQQNARLTDDGELIVENSNAVISMSDDLNTEADSSESITNEPDSPLQQDILEINAEKGSWIEVRDANNLRLFYNTLPVGGSKILVGQAPFSVSLGNAKTTRIVINDLEVDRTKHIRSNNTIKIKVSSEEQNVIIN